MSLALYVLVCVCVFPVIFMKMRQANNIMDSNFIDFIPEQYSTTCV